MAKEGRALFFDGQLGVHFFLWLEHVPLGDRSPWVGQHIRPMAKLSACAVQPYENFTDSIVFADLVIVQNSYNNLNFL